MAFQPFQLPNQSGQSQGMQALAEGLRGYSQWQQERDRMAAENLQRQFNMKRQTQQDREAAIAKATELFKTDPAAAMSLMAQLGTAERKEREVPGFAAPTVGPQASSPTQPQAMDGLASGASPDAISEASAADDWGASQKPQLHPMVAMAQADKAKQKRMAAFLQGKFEDGTPWSIDPEAGREARGQRLDQAFGTSEDPITKEIYPQMRPALMASDQDVDATDVFRHISGEKTNRRLEAQAAERERLRIEKEAADKAEWDRRNGITFEQQKILQPLRAKANATERPETGEGLKAEGQVVRMLELAGGLDTMQPLDAQDRDTILKHAAMEEIYEKSPWLRVAAQTAGQYKTLAEKLSEGGNAYFTQIQEIGAAILRKESGAAISAEEWRNIFLRYAPVRGDSPQVIEQKRRAMYGAIKALANESRKGGAPLKAEVDKRLGKGAATAPKGGAVNDRINRLFGGPK